MINRFAVVVGVGEVPSRSGGGNHVASRCRATSYEGENR